MATPNISLDKDVQQLNQVIKDLNGKRGDISRLGRALTEEEKEVLARIEKALPLLHDALTHLQS